MYKTTFKQPKFLHGAFVEHIAKSGDPQLVLNFQFNPETISRDRSNTFAVPGKVQKRRGWGKEQLTLRQYHQRYKDLTKLRDQQSVKIGAETISFDIRLDATDKLGEGDQTARARGIRPQLATLELMMHPLGESLVKKSEEELLKSKSGFTFSGSSNPPMLLFVWGKDKVLPVNLTSIRVKEDEFDTNLNPIRAIITVSMTVVEGPNKPYLFSKKRKEAAMEQNVERQPDVVVKFIPKTKTKAKPK